MCQHVVFFFFFFLESQEKMTRISVEFANVNINGNNNQVYYVIGEKEILLKAEIAGYLLTLSKFTCGHLEKIFKNKGSRYVGDFKDGNINGVGTLTFPEDDKKGKFYYYGEWKNGYINGLGMLVYKSGDIYVGHWKNGNFHGRGAFIKNDGTLMLGNWNKSKFVG